MTVPAQEFQIGQRVRLHGERQFAITAVFFDGDRFYYAESIVLDTWYFSHELTLCPERLPYVPSEVRIVSRKGDGDGTSEYITWFRPETKAELAARHAIERAAYDAQGDEV